jgi:hypothetical protein
MNSPGYLMLSAGTFCQTLGVGLAGVVEAASAAVAVVAGWAPL